MVEVDDRSYFLNRASRERELAARCIDNAAALAHCRMADEYERRVAMLSERVARRA
jgi:hypothetical protein